MSNITKELSFAPELEVIDAQEMSRKLDNSGVDVANRLDVSKLGINLSSKYLKIDKESLEECHEYKLARQSASQQTPANFSSTSKRLEKSLADTLARALASQVMKDESFVKNVIVPTLEKKQGANFSAGAVKEGVNFASNIMSSGYELVIPILTSWSPLILRRLVSLVDISDYVETSSTYSLGCRFASYFRTSWYGQIDDCSIGDKTTTLNTIETKFKTVSTKVFNFGKLADFGLLGMLSARILNQSMPNGQSFDMIAEHIRNAITNVGMAQRLAVICGVVYAGRSINGAGILNMAQTVDSTVLTKTFDTMTTKEIGTAVSKMAGMHGALSRYKIPFDTMVMDVETLNTLARTPYAMDNTANQFQITVGKCTTNLEFVQFILDSTLKSYAPVEGITVPSTVKIIGVPKDYVDNAVDTNGASISSGFVVLYNRSAECVAFSMGQEAALFAEIGSDATTGNGSLTRLSPVIASCTLPTLKRPESCIKFVKGS